MPVIRITDATWRRLQHHARPLEDTAEDVVSAALDALDRAKGIAIKKTTPAKRHPRGKKLPQKEFRIPLMEVLLELGGSAVVKDIREALAPKIKPRLSEDDFQLVSTGDERWWNATCWERSDLVKEGLLRNDSPRGRWELSEHGRRYILGHLKRS